MSPRYFKFTRSPEDIISGKKREMEKEKKREKNLPRNAVSFIINPFTAMMSLENDH